MHLLMEVHIYKSNLNLINSLGLTKLPIYGKYRCQKNMVTIPRGCKQLHSVYENLYPENNYFDVTK